MPKKAVVDCDACIGCGLCVGSCPAAFDFNDEGKATCIGEADDAEIDDAIANCPVQAISEE
ncbi:MAG: ferredoxin [Bacilli bacterium]|nr:ferredoxin [Bacilli bacterium]